MVKFFRLPRMRSIQTKQVKNYLAYALGEIALVTIGILLALQINNWNEQRKANELRDQYKIQLIENLVADTIAMNENLEILKKELIPIQRYIEFSKRKTVTVRELFDTLKILPFGFIGLSEINRYTIKSLISTGDIKLMNSEVQKMISEIDRKIDLNERYNQLELNNWANLRNWAHEAIIIPNFYNTTIENENITKMLNSKKNLNDALYRYDHAFAVKNYAYNFDLKRLNNTKLLIKNLIIELKKKD